MMGRLVGTMVAAALLGATPAVALPSRPAAIGYLPVFRGLDAAAVRLDPAQYTHLNLAFVNPDARGRILAGDGFACAPDGKDRMLTADSLRPVVAAAHKAGTKVLISLGGGTIPACSGDWEALLRPDNRDKVVKALLGAVDRFGLDGIDIDLEGAILTRIDQAGNYTPFVAALGKALKARGKLLTCATASYDGGMIPVASIPHFDLVGVMSYDGIGPTWGEAGSEHSNVEQARKDLRLWLQRGVARERLVLGLPFYGYGFGSYKANWAYRDIQAAHGEAAGLTDVIGSRCSGCSYITFNGLPTLREKARLAREEAGGIMVWEVSQDTDDHLLIRSINAVVRGAAE
jgi:GH18 family chitinase